MTSVIYVMNFIVEDDEQSEADPPEEAPETQEIPIEKEHNLRNREIRNQEFGKTECNNTKENKTEMSYTDSSIIQSGGGLQKFSPGNVETVENDGLIE